MAGMNSGVSAYQEDAVIRQDAAESQPMSDMGNVPSKYHDASGVPFPGHDAFALAAGTLDTLERPEPEPERQAKERQAEDRARKSATAPVNPNRVEFVTYGDGPKCIDCYWCRDWDTPTAPAFLACTRGVISAANGGDPPCCVTARSERFKHLSCGRDAVWFQDALDR